MTLPEPTHDESRVDRVWRGVEQRLDDGPRRQRRARTLGLATAGVALAAGLLVVIAAKHRPDAAPAARPVTTPSAVVLADGSRITPTSSDAQYVLRIATAERVEIDLAAGEVELEVTHVPGRAFVVTAAGYEASVLGTRFRVRATPGAASALFVAVERGRVRVRGPNVDHVLGAGETWSADVAKTSAAAAATPDEAPAAIEAAGPASAATVGGPHGTTPSAKDLFQRALDARRAGRDREAASGFDQLRRAHRTDARAGLAAYELGRIRLDALQDPAGAAEAFADAVALAPSAPFREDADARRVDALDASGDRKRCEEARAAYLARYPTGLHGNRLSQRCRAR